MVAVIETLLSPYRRAKAELWTEAVPEQQHLSIQLARNSFYFTAALIVIRLFGDQLAI